jgi:glutamine amidotransferase PdxT
VPQFDTRLAGEIGIRRSQCGNFREGMSMNNTKNTSSVQVSTQPQIENFDLLILGGGTGSTIAAWTFAGEGTRVAAIDRRLLNTKLRRISSPSVQV